MPDHPNAVLVRGLLDAFAAGDITAVERHLHADCVWRFPGRRGALAGEHRGRDAVFAFFGRVVALTEGTFAMDVTDVVAGDDRAVVLFRGCGSRPDGRTLDNPTSLVIRLEDGAAVEVDEFVWDLEAVESFWS